MLDQLIAANEGVVLDGLNFRRDEEGWTVIIKAHKGHERLVAFTGGRYWQDLAEVVSYEVTKVGLNWHKDKYAR